jgi:hypothetical protein
MSITIPDKVDYLFKKALGYPETNTLNPPAAEKAYFSKPNVFTFQQLAQELPSNAPNDFILTTAPAGITVSNIYRSRSYPYIYMYSNLTLQSAVSGSSNAFYSPYLKNLISPSLSDTGLYAYKIFTNNLVNDITDDPRYKPTHVIDTDSGVLYFFTYPSFATDPVLNDKPPKVTFYRYEGLTGNVGIASLQEF